MVFNLHLFLDLDLDNSRQEPEHNFQERVARLKSVWQLTKQFNAVLMYFVNFTEMTWAVSVSSTCSSLHCNLKTHPPKDTGSQHVSRLTVMGKMTELVQRQIFAYWLDVDQGKRAANIFWVWYVEKRYNSDVHNTDSGLNTYPKPNHNPNPNRNLSRNTDPNRLPCP